MGKFEFLLDFCMNCAELAKQMKLAFVTLTTLELEL